MQLVRQPFSSSSISSGSDGNIGLVSALKSAWISARKDIVARRKLKAAVNELSSLDDAMLADMGITRGEIRSIVLGAKH
jgi:uncharacterized protein YjiS (DUF1127 family)